MIEKPIVEITGVGMLLPGGDNGICNGLNEFWEVLQNNKCCISEYYHQEIPLRIAGQVRGWDPMKELDIPHFFLKKYSRGTLLSVASTKRALEHSGLKGSDLSNERTLLILTSVLFTFENLSTYYNSYADKGHKGVGIGFWISGTPGSMASTICSLLDIECQTMTMSGSCNVGSRAIETAYDLFKAGRFDRAIIIGVDATLDPVFLSASLYKSRTGYRAASLSKNPESIRPHDKQLDGNAPGEGAVTIVLEKKDKKIGKESSIPFRIYSQSSRKNGSSPVSSGIPINFSHDLNKVLREADINLNEVGFINDFCEGAYYIESFYSEAINHIRDRFNYYKSLTLTNHEGAFGHIPGATSLIKLLANLLMMDKNIIAPVTNCREKFIKLNADPVIGNALKKPVNHSLIMSGGSGGDATTILLEKVMGRH